MSGVDLSSIVACRNIYIDYYYKGNKADTDVDDIIKIEQKYEGYLEKWNKIGGGDDNQYVISDEDWNLGEDEGHATAREISGYNASGGRNVGRFVLEGGQLAAGAFAGAAAIIGAWIIAIPISLASAILAISTDMNGDAARSLGELADGMVEQQNELANAQIAMEEAANTVAENEQEVVDITDSNNAQILALQTQTNSFYNSYVYLNNRKKNGETLTAGEESLLKTLDSKISANNTTQSALVKTSSETRNTAISELSEYSETYDAAAMTMANTQGMTDEGASYDKATRVLCYVAIAADALNVAASVTNGAQALSVATCPWFAWAWAFVAAAAAAVVMSGLDGMHQIDYLQTTNTEIGVREYTEEYNENVAGTYDTDITEFNGSIQSLTDLKGLELKQKTVPTTVQNQTSENTNETQEKKLPEENKEE